MVLKLLILGIAFTFILPFFFGGSQLLPATICVFWHKLDDVDLWIIDIRRFWHWFGLYLTSFEIDHNPTRPMAIGTIGIKPVLTLANRAWILVPFILYRHFINQIIRHLISP